MSAVHVQIQYAGMRLDVYRTEDGKDVTPLKPIVELFGLSWKMQHKKVTEDPYLMRKLGGCIHASMDAGTQKRDVFCILLASVSMFLLRLNPNMIRAQGNVSSADFLEAKHDEWIAALDDYESLGAAFNMNHAKAQAALERQQLHLARLAKAAESAKDPQAKALLERLVGDAAGKLGYSYARPISPQGELPLGK